MKLITSFLQAAGTVAVVALIVLLIVGVAKFGVHFPCAFITIVCLGIFGCLWYDAYTDGGKS